MIIVKLMGGMGNQMFQYAAGRRLAIKHKTILKLDLSFLLDKTPRENFTYRAYDLDVYNIQENFTSFIDKIKQKLKLINVIQQPHYHFYKKILSAPDNSYLVGFWQSEKYFIDIEQVIRKDFTLKFDLDYETKKMAEKIKSLNAVCLNVRRGDFVSNPVANKFHGVCNLEYYLKSIEYITDRVSNPHFFVFSDDLEWCKKNLQIDYPFTIVSHIYAGKKFEFKLKLMTLCKHYIISNSSFAWWGVWLNKNLEKIVIAPKKWFNDTSRFNDILINTIDLIPETWIRI